MKKIKKIQEKLKEKNLGTFLITNPSNIFYLTGIRGFDLKEREFLLVISRKGFKLIIPKAYLYKIKGEVPEKNLVIVGIGIPLLKGIIGILKKYKKIGFEKEDLKYDEYEILKKNLKGRKIISITSLIEDFRKIKDWEEINRIKKAAEITDKTFYLILKMIKPGLTEKFLQRKIIEIMENLGAEGTSFEPIIASGKESADPHHIASNKKIDLGEILLIDIGAKYKGYCSDFTRTVFVGRASAKFKKLYNIIFETQEKLIKKCRDGYSIKKLYRDAFLIFKKNKKEKNFLHSLGHGVGIDVHEFPSISINSRGKFEKGMVITIESGLYFKDFGGIRIEDLCLINKKECEVLTKANRELIEIK